MALGAAIAIAAASAAAGQVAGQGANALFNKKEEDPNRPKNRRLTAFLESNRQRFDRSQAMMAAIAQAHQDYAQLF